MGPLVPDVIGNELNLIVALFIGIGFGFILEQAGFSTSKKLVGLFYGYDFTVLRVFFTAGVTAMLGVVAFNHFGLLDVNLIYVNPTYLWSAIVGGFIMGLGFVIGGFCPGTSVCAAAIGKIDAMIFIAGSFLGVLLFAEGYPLFEGLYKAEYWGNVRIFDTLGMSQSLFAFLLTVVAVAAFWATTLVENKVNGQPNPEFSYKPLYYGLTGIAVILALSAFVLPDRRENMLDKLNDISFVNSYPVNYMDTDELAFRIVDKDPRLQIVDIRTPAEFKRLTLPGSVQMNIENIFDKDAHKILSDRRKKILFIATDELTGKKAAVLAKELGYTEVFYLKGGMESFVKDIMEFKPPEFQPDRNQAGTYRFRAEASTIMPELIKEYQKKSGGTEPKKSKRVIGGC